MKKIITCLCLLILISETPCPAQETVSLNIIYEFRYIRDIALKDSPYIANMVLSVGKHTSRYCTEKLFDENDKGAVKRKQLQQERQNATPGPVTSVAGGPLLIVNRHGAIINEEVICNVADSTMNIYAQMGFKSYKAGTATPKIDWKIHQERKMIGIYACQKATGIYAGRTYEAWFAPDIPYRHGPWKLTGLPGLILEAKDLKNEITFTFKKLVRNTDPEENTRSFLNSPDNINTGLKAYNKAKKAFETDPESVMAAMAPNATVAVINTDDSKAEHARKIKKYNPMELE